MACHAIISGMEKPPIPLVIAHRGCSAHAPENTLAAFRMAHEAGADGIELDVMLSADDRLVVIHDATVDRTTNGNGRVDRMPYAALRELDAGAKFSEAFQGERLPLLEQVYEALGGKFLINVELKNYAHPFDQLTQKVVRLTQAHGLVDSVMFSSFNPLNLSRARRLEPRIRLGLLTFPGNAGRVLRGKVGLMFPQDALHPYFEDVTASMVEAAHKRGHQVNPWTVDDPAALKRLKELGVDMVICNDPAAARLILEG